MRRYTYEITTTLPPDRLFRAIADIARWPEWDSELESTTVIDPVREGARFALKPKGGPKVSMLIETAKSPERFVDVALLPLARMRTAHEFTVREGGATVRTTIEIQGPLAFFWDRIVARKQAAGAEMQARNFLAFAERLP